MEQLNRDGLARAVGVSNFHEDRLVDLIAHNEIVSAVDQIEVHPFHERAADHEVMRGHGVQIESVGSPRAKRPVHQCAAHRDRYRSRQAGRAGGAALAHATRPSRSPPVGSGWSRTSLCSTSSSPRPRWIASRPWTPAPRFFDHRDPAMVDWLNAREGDRVNPGGSARAPALTAAPGAAEARGWPTGAVAKCESRRGLPTPGTHVAVVQRPDQTGPWGTGIETPVS